MLEQEVASAIKFIHSACGSPPPYYWNVPQDFVLPSIYFPVPEIMSFGETLNSYKLEYTWHIKCFAKTNQAAYNMALRAAFAIKGSRNLIPLIDVNGEPEGKGFRLQDPSLRQIDEGVSQITIKWNSSRVFDDVLNPTSELTQKFIVREYYRPDIHLAERMTMACHEAIERYHIVQAEQ